MRPELWERVQALFDACVEQTPSERRAYLDEACAGDPALRAEVESLLDASGGDRDPIADAVASGAKSALDSEAAGRVGRRIGSYEIQREIGHGGMGTVYLARRADDSYEKAVAIKIVRGGLDRPDLLARFRSERQILASLDHPNIARLLDGGTTEDGLPYVVMEYVEGASIDRYCDDNGLSVVERVRLIREVCGAAQFAHRSLVIHRDIKPGNILVGKDGTPKLLDFGIAKLFDPQSREQAATETVGRMFTPEFASPEQLSGGPITTAIDVYSLGVVLHVLLTGQRPASPSGDAPSRAPSTVVQKHEYDASRARATSPDRLRRALRGDLDNIILMALRNEPERRYGSVEELSDDLGRYLDGHPVRARKDSWSYRTGKFVVRNKLGVAAAAIIVALILGFGVGMSVLAARLVDERDFARQAQGTAESATTFMEELFKVSDPSEARGDSITAREILETGVPKIREDLQGQPLVQARLLRSVGVVYRNLGLFADARATLEQALAVREASLPPDHPDIAQSLADLGTVLKEVSDYDGARSLHERALEIRKASLGPDDPAVAQSLGSLASILSKEGDLDAAEETFRRAIEILENNPSEDFNQLQATRNNLAVVYQRMEDFDRSIAILEQVARDNQAELGDDHPDVARSMQNLGVSLAQRGEYDRALPHLERAVEVMEKTLGSDHPQLATAYTNLAFVLGRTGHPERKLELEQRALELAENNLGLDHPEVGLTLINVGHSLLAANRFAEAQAVLERAVSNLEASLGPEHVYVGSALGALSDALVHRWELDGHRATLERASRITEQQAGRNDARFAVRLFYLGVHSRFDGRDDEAETLFRQALATLEQAHSDDRNMPRILMELAIVCARRGRDDEAESFCARALEAYGRPSEDPRALYAQARYAAANGDPARALELLEEASRGGYPMDRIERDPDLEPLRGQFGAVFPH